MPHDVPAARNTGNFLRHRKGTWSLMLLGAAGATPGGADSAPAESDLGTGQAPTFVVNGSNGGTVPVPVAEVDEPAQPIGSTTFQFPRYLDRQGLSVSVRISFVIDEKGVVRQVRLLQVRVVDAKTREPIDRTLIERMVQAGALPEADLTRSVDEVRSDIVTEVSRATVRNVRNWMYRPAQKDGKPVVSELTTGVFNIPPTPSDTEPSKQGNEVGAEAGEK